MPIKNIVELTALFKSWLDFDQDLAGRPLPEIKDLPEAFITLNDCLGRLWMDTNHPLSCIHNGQPKTLMNSQNIFHDPRYYRADELGIVLIWSENQGVMNFGYVPGDPYLYAYDGYWYGREDKNIIKPPYESDTDWGRTSCLIEHGIIELLLMEFIFMFGTQCDNKRSDTDVILLEGHLFEGFDHWTDASRSYVANGHCKHTIGMANLDFFMEKLSHIPLGKSRCNYLGNCYSVTMIRSDDGRQETLEAKQVGGTHHISFDVNHPSSGKAVLKLKESPDQEVVDFVSWVDCVPEKG